MRPLCMLLLLCASGFGQDSATRTLLRAAIEQQSKGDFTAAIAGYRRVLQAHPDSVIALSNMAAALASLHQFDEAATAYRRALKVNGDDPELHKNLALALYSANDVGAAIPELTKAAAAHPQDAALQLILAECELRAGHPARALALIENFPEGSRSEQWSYLRGMALIRMGRAEEGVGLVESFARHTVNADAMLLAGATQLNLGHVTEARSDLDALVRDHPEVPGALTYDGLAHDQAGDEEEAKRLFHQAIKLSPDDFEANLHFGAVLFREKDYDAAFPPIQKALAIRPDDPMAQYAHALIVAAQGRLDQAATELQSIVRASPEWIEPRVKLSAIYFKLRRDDDGRRERAAVDDLNARHAGRSSPFETR